MAAPTILRLAVSESANDFVLVHISSAGSRPLDLRLRGTENESVFAAQLKQSQTSSLKTKNCPCDQRGWDAILQHILLGSEGQHELLQGVEAIAKVERSDLTITIQKKIEGIIQKLGSIALHKDDKAADDADLFEWCGIAVSRADSHRHELAELKSELKNQHDRAEKLNQTLEELIKAKADHEQELFQKFALLLNEKKLKIRDQQRLLASASLDPRKLEAVQASRSTSKRAVGTSRAGKRKAKEGSKNESEDDEEPGFERMDIDMDDGPAPQTSDHEELRRSTDISTAEDTDPDDRALPDRSTRRTTNNAARDHNPRPSTSSSTEPEVDAEVPAQADQAAAAAAATKKASLEGSETESDDEL